MNSIDLNCDLGESYGKYSSVYDAEIMPYISSCNIACGFHSGDPFTIERTIQLALDQKVAIGAHPSFPDLQGFGRRVMVLSAQEIRAVVRYQVYALKGMTEALGGRLHHVKLHGALYNQAMREQEVAQAVVEALAYVSEDLILYGLPGAVLGEMATAYNLRYANEVFADRAYEEDLSLRSRHLPGAVIEEPEAVLQQVSSMILDKKVTTYQGAVQAIHADTICLHSDTPGAVALAKKLHEMLRDHGIEILAA